MPSRGTPGMYAKGLLTADIPAVYTPTPLNAEVEMVDFVMGLSVAEIRALVSNGSLTAEDVYEAELRGKRRMTLLDLYSP